MVVYTCPEGHSSQDGDWCDVCGAAITPSTPAGGAAPATSGPSTPSNKLTGAASMLTLDPPASVEPPKACPNCGIEGSADALFCEECGYDFTTGQLPEPAGQDPVTPDPPATSATSASGAGDGGGAGEAAPTAPATTGTAETETAWVAEIWIDPDWYAFQDSEDVEPCPTSGLPKVVALPGTTALIGRRSKSRGIEPEIECGTDTSVSRKHAELTRDRDRWFLTDLDSTNGTYTAPSSGPLPKDAMKPNQRYELGDNDRIYVGAWTRIVVRQATEAERELD